MNSASVISVRVAADGTKTTAVIEESKAVLHFEADSYETYVQLTFCPDYAFDSSEYVLLPACSYNGNRFDVLPKDYPPMYTREEAGVDMSVTMADVIRLNKDGSGIIEATTGDVATPCIGLYLPKYIKGILLFTTQEFGGVNFGLCYEQGRMMIRWPFFREKAAYRRPHMKPSQDKGRVFHTGDTVEIPYKYLSLT